MPIFFILSGYTFKIKPNKALLTSSIKRLLLPYLLLCLIWNGILNGLVKKLFSASAFLQTVFWGSGSRTPLDIAPVGMAWFLISLFWAKLFFNTFQIIFNKISNFILSNSLQIVTYISMLLLGIFLGGYAEFVPT